MQIAKQCFFFLALATAALFMPHAKATCTSSDMPKQINIAAVSVSTTLPVGSTIPGSEQIAHIAGNCDQAADSGLAIVSCYYGTGAEIPGLNGVYDSGVPGIGVALMNDKGQRISGAGGTQCISNGTPVGYVSDDGQQSFNFDVTLELVKTSDSITSGTLVQTQTRFGIGVFGHEGIGDPNTISYAGNVNFNEVTCSVSPKSLTIIMGDFPVSDFTEVGSVTNSRPFEVGVNCTDTVQPEVMVSSANGYDANNPSVIKLTQEAGVATGVGVRMLYDGQLVTFDTYRDTAAVAEANETLTIPFVVNYQQTSPEVTPGPANSIATITLGYK